MQPWVNSVDSEGGGDWQRVMMGGYRWLEDTCPLCRKGSRDKKRKSVFRWKKLAQFEFIFIGGCCYFVVRSGSREVGDQINM